MRDIRRAWRRVTSASTLSALVVLILGVAFAVHLTTLATVAVILRPQVQVADASRLVALSLRDPKSGRPGAFTELTAEPLSAPPALVDWLGLYASRLYRLETGDRTLDVVGEAVAPAFFDAVRVPAAAGRLLEDTDNVAGAAVAVVSYRLAARLFGGPAQAVGRVLTIDSTRLTIVGVAAERFVGLEADAGVDVWLPIRPARFMAGDGDRPRAPMLIGRLHDGDSLAAARAQIAARWAAARSTGDVVQGSGAAGLTTYAIQVEPLTYGLSPTRPQWANALTALLTLSTLLLALSVASVMGVMLTRALARSREVAVERAMGAPRLRLLRGPVIEATLLVAAAYLIAVPMTFLAGRHLTAELSFARPIALPPLLPDLRVWSWSAVLVTTIVAAMALPGALQTLRMSPAEGSRRASRSLGWTGRMVVTAQVLLSLLLMVGAGLLLTTRWNLSSNVGGLDDPRVMFASLSRMPGDRGALPDEYFDQLLNDLGQVPGVELAALASTFPAYAGFIGALPVNTFTAATAGAEVEATGLTEYISPGFLSTLGVHVVAGRDIQWQDVGSSRPVALLTQSLARTLFPTGAVIGGYVHQTQGDQTSKVEVVGVVPDLPMGSLRAPEVGTVFRPLKQGGGRIQSPIALVRITAGPGHTAEHLADTVAAQRHHFVRAVFTLDAWFTNALLRERLLAAAAAVLAVVAIALASLGVYVAVAHAAAVRREEIGIRMCLGATRRRVLMYLLKESAWSMVVGVVVGVPLARGLGRALASQLYGVDPASPYLLFVGTVVVLASVLFGATVPALQASKHEPADILRQE
jgi:predicted permease